ncbi:MAG: 2-amino-4-hydroxy-6-hydroxymethyldihydropteridine diphosphokinase [Propionibacteriales bacterium]|nr:2-amino-4-hydroxy-6-hydroxymethyldihydropteridine diphosphokinase [Propionibacteriales bacterium]
MTETPNPHIVDTDTLSGQLRPFRRAVLSLGSNLGDREANIQGAVSSLADTPDVYLVDRSPVYETAPVDSPVESEDFLNAVLIVDTTLSADTLLERCLAVEDAFGRERGERNAPRTLDIDLLVLGDKQVSRDSLTLPHPRAHERAFVLQPWFDIDPNGEIPGQGRIADLIGGVDAAGVRRRDDVALELP